MSSSISQVQNRARNLIEVLNTIEPGKPVALSDLAQRVETDTSTLRRDLDILSHCDIDMFYIDIDIDDDDNVTLLRPPFSLNLELRLTEEQMLAISLALEMAGATSQEDLIARINASFAGTFNEDLLENHIHVSTPAHSFDVFEAVTAALQFGFALAFDYESSSGEITHRRADVARITSEREGWYFHGFDYDRKKQRTFKLSRIMHPEILYFEKSLGRNNTDVTESAADSLAHIAVQGAPLATLNFASRQAYVPRDWPLSCGGKQLTGNAGGGYQIDVPLINRDFIALKVISLGGLVHVKYPEELRNYVTEKARALQKEYE